MFIDFILFCLFIYLIYGFFSIQKNLMTIDKNFEVVKDEFKKVQYKEHTEV